MEPWLAGSFSHLAPVPRLLCCSLEQSIADIRRWIGPLTDSQIWMTSFAGNSVGFHMRHLAGSVDRLTAYANEAQLSPEQLTFLRTEAEPGGTKENLLTGLSASYANAAAFAETATDLDSPRYIGRQRLETPLGVLLGHIAEHTQRHTGQLIVLAQFAVRSHE